MPSGVTSQSVGTEAGVSMTSTVSAAVSRCRNQHINRRSELHWFAVASRWQLAKSSSGLPLFIKFTSAKYGAVYATKGPKAGTTKPTGLFRLYVGGLHLGKACYTLASPLSRVDGNLRALWHRGGGRSRWLACFRCYRSGGAAALYKLGRPSAVFAPPDAHHAQPVGKPISPQRFQDSISRRLCRVSA